MLLRACWYIVLATALLAAELLLAALPLPLLGTCLLLPASFLLAFYLTVARHWQPALLTSALLAISVEIWFSRQSTVLLLLPLVTWASTWWQRYGSRQAVLPQAIPGALLGALYAVRLTWGETPRAPGAWPAVAADALGAGLAGLLTGAVALPLLIVLADAVGGRLGLPRFSPHRLPQAPPDVD